MFLGPGFKHCEQHTAATVPSNNQSIGPTITSSITKVGVNQYVTVRWNYLQYIVLIQYISQLMILILNATV